MGRPCFRLLAATAVAALAVTSVACGQGGGDDLLRVATSQTAAGTVRFVAEVVQPDIELPPELEGVLLGEETTPPPRIEGQADLAGDLFWYRRADSGSNAGGRPDVAFIGDRVLVRSDLAPEGKRPATPWIGFASFPAAARHFPEEVGAVVATGAGFGGYGPEDALRFLEEAGGRLEGDGGARVRGVDTRRYRVAFDTGRYRRWLGGLFDAQTSAAEDASAAETGAPASDREGTGDAPTLEEIRRSVDEAVPPPVTVWIDADDRLRRIETSPLGVDDAGEPGIILRTEFFDFGAPMDIAPPGPEAITDAAGLDLPVPSVDDEWGDRSMAPGDGGDLPLPTLPENGEPPTPDPSRGFPTPPEAVDPNLPAAGRSRLRLSAPPGSSGVEAARGVVIHRLRAFGAAAAEVTVDGDTLLVVWKRGNVPGAVTEVASAPGHFAIHPLLSDQAGECAPASGGAAGPELSVPGTEDGQPRCYRLGAAALDQPGVASAAPFSFDGEDWTVDIELDDQAAAAFDEVAARHYGRRLALVLDGTVLSAPTVQARTFEGRLQITGSGFNELKVRRLAGLLAGGPLPTTLVAGPLEH